MAKSRPEPGLRFRRLADKSEGEREVRYLARNVVVDDDGNALIDPGQVDKILFNPATPELEHEPWPAAGFAIEGDPPKRCSIGTAKVAELRSDGFLEVEGATDVYRHGGPEENPTAVIHGFVHCDALIFKTVDGDVRYRVVGQPDKYDAKGEPGHHAGNPDAEVRWYYELELEA